MIRKCRVNQIALLVKYLCGVKMDAQRMYRAFPKVLF